MTMQDKRWYCVEARRNGSTSFVGRIEATGDEIMASLGPCVEINPVNGSCLIYGKPNGGIARN